MPSGKTLDPSLADASWQIGNIKREIPIIASAMDGVIDVRMAVELSKLGALGVLNLEGIQTRYEDPNPILDRIAAVGNDFAIVGNGLAIEREQRINAWKESITSA